MLFKLQIMVVSLVLVFVSACENEKTITHKKTNVILISIDTLRADHVGAYGYNRNTTQFIDELAMGGVLFKNAHVPLPATSASHTSMLTGLHPLQHNVRSNGTPIDDSIVSIAEKFKDAGYHTIGAVSVTHLSGKYGFAQGFENYSDTWGKNSGGSGEWERDAEKTTDATIEMIDNYVNNSDDVPLFLFLHYFDPHAPYLKRTSLEPSENIIRKYVNDYEREKVDSYDSEIRFVDTQIARLFSYLESKKLTDNFVFVITADHGEQLGEHNYFGGHPDIYVENVRVPLIFGGSMIKKGVVEANVSSMDIAPTLLALNGMQFLHDVSGSDLFNNYEPFHHLIIGYPGYTRSAGLIEKSNWYIENMDHVFGKMWIEEQLNKKVKKNNGSKSASLVYNEKESKIFSIKYLPENNLFIPAFISADINLYNDDECAVGFDIQLSQGNAYFDTNKKKMMTIFGSTTIHYPVNPFDHTLLHFNSAQCVKNVSYQISSPEKIEKMVEAKSANFKKLEPDIFKRLLTMRKRTKFSELYDLSEDPAMLTNLSGKSHESTLVADRLRNILILQYTEMSDQSLNDQYFEKTASEELLKSLKTLGYIQ